MLTTVNQQFCFRRVNGVPFEPSSGLMEEVGARPDSRRDQNQRNRFRSRHYRELCRGTDMMKLLRCYR